MASTKKIRICNQTGAESKTCRQAGRNRKWLRWKVPKRPQSDFANRNKKKHRSKNCNYMDVLLERVYHSSSIKAEKVSEMEETCNRRKYIATKYHCDMKRSAAKLLYVITSQQHNYDRRPIHHVTRMQPPQEGIQQLKWITILQVGNLQKEDESPQSSRHPATCGSG